MAFLGFIQEKESRKGNSAVSMDARVILQIFLPASIGLHSGFVPAGKKVYGKLLGCKQPIVDQSAKRSLSNGCCSAYD
jgi:hypothetical protein